MTRGGKRKNAGAKREFKNPIRASFVIERADWAKIRKIAEQQGVSASELTRTWLLERLRR